MFKFFKKKEGPREIADRIHVATQDLFKEIGATPTLAEMHKAALHGKLSENECNDLALGAYRTLILAAGVARYRMIQATGDEEAADRLANSFSESSGLSNIVQIILESIPFNKTELNAVTDEANFIFQAATLVDRASRNKQLKTAHELWLKCLKGAYIELPMVYAGM
jgi:hypothetical protein